MLFLFAIYNASIKCEQGYFLVQDRVDCLFQQSLWEQQLSLGELLFFNFFFINNDCVLPFIDIAV